MIARLKNMLNNLSTRDRNIIVVLLTLLAVFAIYWVIMQWYYPKMMTLNETKNNLETEIYNLQQTLLVEKDIDAEIIEKRSTIEQLLDRFDWQVLKGEPLLALGDKSEILLRKLQLTALSQGKVETIGSILKAPYDVNVRGSIDSVKDYLVYLENLNKAMNYSYMKISYNDPFNVNDIAETISLDLKLNAYGAKDAANTKQYLSEITGRNNIFAPTVDLNIIELPEPNIEPPIEIEKEQTVIRKPRYDFPTKQEINTIKE